MKMPRKKFWTFLLCALCAAALALPTWAANAANESGASQAARTVVSGAEDEDLFYGYLLQRAGASDRVSLMSDAGSKLSAKDKGLYDKLRDWAAKVADGQETKAVCRIFHDDFPLVWTKEDLGVAAIYDESSGTLTAECREAIRDKQDECLTYDFDAIYHALLADCPYEMYWFDKTAQSPMELAVVNADNLIWSLFSDKGERKLRLAEAPICDVLMAVSADYAEGDSLTVNRALHAGIDNTVAKASSIVSAYADKSDYDKLLGYSTEICNLVKYDAAAADEDTHTPYGDPWQLISVFDGNPDTDVVCEGYAKAFKYLCDLSAFSSPNVECYLVTGDLIDGKGAGDHMWNIVTMENGKSYLVDVTNSDGDEEDDNLTPDYLLLKGGSPSETNPIQYVFYDRLTFAYDNATVSLWGDALLTLATEDYRDAVPVTPSPALRLGGYALSVSGEAVNMAHVRDGATIFVKKDDSETESNATLFLVVYNEQGRMESFRQWDLNVSQLFISIPEQGADAFRAKFIILSENLTPLASAATLESSSLSA